MSFPQPVPGLVIRYSYLWAAEHLQGREEGVKDRPCAVVMAITTEAGKEVVTVVPVTHSPPSDPALAIEIPYLTKQRLGLDDQRSWIVVAEANRFVWPGPDMRFAPGSGAESVSFGMLPGTILRSTLDKLIGAIEAKLVTIVPRTE